jgi:hypothetical protein
MIMNNPWVVGIVCALVGVIGALLIKDRRKKRLGLEVVSSTKLITKLADTEGIEFLYKKELVEDPHLVVIRICNNGNVPIAKDDFDQPLTLRVGTSILECNVVETTPGLRPEITRSNPDELRLEPVLLNPLDSIRIQLILESAANVKHNGRIVGGQVRALAVGTKPIGPLVNWYRLLRTLLLSGIMFIALLPALESHVKKLGIWSVSGLSLIVLAVLVVTALPIIIGEKYQDRSKWPDKWR